MSLDNNFSFDINYKRNKSVANPQSINITNPLKVYDLSGKEDINLESEFNKIGNKELAVINYSNKKRTSIEHEEELQNISYIPKPAENIIIKMDKYPDISSLIPKPN